MNPLVAWYKGLPPVLRGLITANVVMYALFLFFFQWVDVALVAAHRFLALTPTPLGVLYAPWTVLTYAVTHLTGGLGGFLDVLFGVLILAWVGDEMERMLGGAWLLVAYFVAALGGALAALAFAAATGAGFPYAGSGAAVLGVMMATATRYPQREIGLLFIGAVRLIYVVFGFLALTLLLSGRAGLFLFAVQAGGVLAAFLFSLAEKRGADLHSWAGRLVGSRSGRPHRAAPRRAEAAPARVVPIEAAAPRRARATQAEVDRILDKISAEGRAALTPDERRILDEYSRR